jgi:predicted RNase H-like nuclease (RuvC/YqgF family)
MDNQPIIIKNGRSNIVSIIALVIILILAYMHFFKTDDSFAIREQILQTQIDSLKTKVSEYKSERDSLDNNIHNLNDSLFNLQSEIINKSNQIYKLKKAYAKKVEHINNYTVSDINKYLTDRYKK